jgi:DNA mismatch endonuclease, patch repair protein
MEGLPRTDPGVPPEQLFSGLKAVMERFLKDKLPDGEFKDVNPSHQRIMQAVRGKGNRTTETRFRAALVSAGIRGWKINYSSIYGCPDFFFPTERIALFVDGCFWHGCERCGHIPKKNNAFWQAKIMRNRDRDVKTTAKLRRQGISVIRFWEHEIKESLKSCISLLTARILAKQRKYTSEHR